MLAFSSTPRASRRRWIPKSWAKAHNTWLRSWTPRAMHWTVARPTSCTCRPTSPVKNFWSVILYDNQTRSMIQTDQQFPSVSSQTGGLKVNADGSVDVYFGPTSPAGKEKNWVQTVPGKGWNVILRLYSPLKPWFAKMWRPGEIELAQ